MNKVICILLVLSGLFFSGEIYSQIDPELLQQAKAAGISQSQIDAAVAKKGETNQQMPATTGNKETVDRSKAIQNKDLKKDQLKQQQKQSDKKLYTETYGENLRDSVIKPKIFGRDIFSSENLSFEPNYNIATPIDYVLGAGDEVIIDVWGTSELNVKQTISPEGSINIPNVGVVYLNGLKIEDAEKRLKSKLGNIITGIGDSSQLKLSLGQIRSIKVNIAGEVIKPGTYTMPSLTTLFNAIYAAGGVNDIGSMRNIKVYRNSKLLGTLDVYDYIINGNYDTNIRLEDNDMIIVPAYDAFVTTEGKLKREMIFEMKNGEPLAKLIGYAGGFTGDAYKDYVTVKRKSSRTYEIYDVNNAEFNTFGLSDGDVISVGEVIPEFSNKVSISGAVWRPGEYQISPSVNNVSALIKRAEGLKGNEFGSTGQIIRLKKDYTYESLPFNIKDVVLGKTNIELQKQDSIHIPSIMELREEFTVKIDGAVNNPTIVPYRENMTIADVIISASGLKESASLANIEVSRRVKDPNATTYSNKMAEIFSLKINEDLTLPAEAKGYILNPFDEVNIRVSPGYQSQKNVSVIGEVLFGGNYAIKQTSERLSDLVKRAGGVTPEAYISGASLKRALTDDEKEKVLSVMKLSRKGATDSMSFEDLNIESVYSVGIDLEAALKNPYGVEDVVLKEGDILNIPGLNNTVKISGAVLYPNTVVLKGSKLKNYISEAGGFADGSRKRPFVVYMNGSVASTKQSLFFKRYPKIKPGCEVIVPMKKYNPNKTSLAEILSIGTSATSMAAMVTSILNTAK